MTLAPPAPAFPWHFHTDQVDDATGLVLGYHYSRRMPNSLVMVGTAHDSGGLFGDYGPAFAACVFGIPPTRWAEEVIELQRLVLHPARTGFPLTSLIAKTVQAIRRLRRGVDLLVSFADRTEGHHGGIYQSASWRYAGCRERQMDGLIVNGRFVPGRSCNSRWGTRSPTKLKAKYPLWDVAPHFDEGKHLYWRAVHKRGFAKAKRLGLADEQYPKPSAIS